MVTLELFKKFKKLNILVLGDVFLDEYIQGNCSRISPEAPVPVLKYEKTHAVLGGAANVASNIASMGGKAKLLCFSSKDENFKKFRTLAKSRNIQILPIANNAGTITKTRVVGKQQQLLRIDNENIQELSPQLENKILEKYLKSIHTISAVVFSDYAKGFFSKSLCKKLIKIAQEHRIPVIADPKPSNKSFYKGCDFITPNWKEAQEISGLKIQKFDKESVKKVSKKISDELSCNVITTLGAKGIFLLNDINKRSVHLPTQAMEVFDVSGAGDTVISLFTLAYAAGLKAKDAISIANKAAGIVVGKIGTATVSPEELMIDELLSEKKLLDREHLQQISEKEKAAGKTIVTINGSFDLLHFGHIYILEQAKRLGNILIVGLNSDKSIKEYKNAERPIIPEQLRSKSLLSLKCVDYVHIFDETVPMPFLRKVKPHIHVNGDEYGKNCIEANTVERYGGTIHIVKKLPGLSTSSIIKKIQSMKRD